MSEPEIDRMTEAVLSGEIAIDIIVRCRRCGVDLCTIKAETFAGGEVDDDFANVTDSAEGAVFSHGCPAGSA